MHCARFNWKNIWTRNNFFHSFCSVRLITVFTSTASQERDVSKLLKTHEKCEIERCYCHCHRHRAINTTYTLAFFRSNNKKKLFLLLSFSLLSFFRLILFLLFFIIVIAIVAWEVSFQMDSYKAGKKKSLAFAGIKLREKNCIFFCCCSSAVCMWNAVKKL